MQRRDLVIISSLTSLASWLIWINFNRKIWSRVHSIFCPDPLANIDVIYYSNLKFLGTLGYGAQGIVELASNELHQMAVKRQNQRFPSHSSELKRELVVLMKVGRHPNIVQVLSLLYQSPERGILDSTPIGYSMEYMPGGSLYNVIHGSPGSPLIEYDYVQMLKWIKQAACALLYIHRKRIIHRDVKPQNMLLDTHHQVLKICDLGASTIKRTLNTSTRGTFEYMAPEVMSVEERTVYSESCDVYSLAITIWEMQHRRTPFDFNGDNVIGFAHMVRNGLRPVISENSDVELAEIIQRGWSSNVNDRPSMREIHTFTVDTLKKLKVHCDDSLLTSFFLLFR